VKEIFVEAVSSRGKKKKSGDKKRKLRNISPSKKKKGNRQSWGDGNMLAREDCVPSTPYEDSRQGLMEPAPSK